MKTSITEEMRFRQRVVEFAIKQDNNAMAARRCHTSRQQVERWRKKYDGSVQSLANKSFQRYSRRYSNIARRILNFKTPNEKVADYLKKVA